ncbi:MAG: heme o synthase [Bacteroidia bacterium]
MQQQAGNTQQTEMLATAPKASRARAYVQILKPRLSLLVAISSVFGYAMAAGAAWEPLLLVMMGLGGMFITGASNILNQIFEKQYDAQMQRTMNRPLPTGSMGAFESLVYALILATVGIGMIGYFFNLSAALLGIIGLLSYAFVYTPMKRWSSASVFVGAIPGALPPLIGWVGVTGALDTPGLLLFGFQFFWQFPHFWAIAWLLDDDYKKAGFKMLPSADGRSRRSAIYILTYSVCLVPLALFPYFYGMVAFWAAIALLFLGLAFMYPAIQLFRSLDAKHAKRLMFFSFMYLPVMQIIFLLGN